MNSHLIRFSVGTYTTLGGDGVLSFVLDASTLEAECTGKYMMENPSFFTTDPTGEHYYAVGENGEWSMVHHLALGGMYSGTLESVFTGGDPCHIMWLSKQTLCTANYTSGTVQLHDVDPVCNYLGQVAQTVDFHECGPSPRQQSSHIHFCALTPDGEYLAAVDLGGDCIHMLKIVHNEDGTARLLRYGKTSVPPETGPRHLCFSHCGRYAYLITELSDEVLAFAYENGNFTFLQALKAAPEPAHASAHIMVHPNGKWLYASVRRQRDGIAVYHIGDDGRLTQVAYTPTGLHPRHFNITPDGTLLLCACRDSDSIEIFRINATDGTLKNAHHPIAVAKPVCIQFLP
ncbi:MAG: lactonase family protein [Bacteroidales bacterium]|nr:lactonase family protein [Bacteroidales bacterium]